MALSMSRELTLHAEEEGGLRRVQVGEFAQRLSETDARLLSEITFARAGGQVATLSMLCPNREFDTVLPMLDSLGGQVSSPSVPRRWTQRLFGSSALVVRGLNQESLACSLQHVWENSPLVWGVRVAGAAQDFPIQWLNQSATPSPAFAAEWRVLLISFYHGAWVGLYGDGASETPSFIPELAGSLGYTTEESPEPL
jgi:hypothetical protein